MLLQWYMVSKEQQTSVTPANSSYTALRSVAFSLGSPHHHINLNMIHNAGLEEGKGAAIKYSLNSLFLVFLFFSLFGWFVFHFHATQSKFVTGFLFCSLIILKTLRCLYYNRIHAMHAHTTKLMATRNQRIDMNGHKIIVGAPETSRLKSTVQPVFPIPYRALRDVHFACVCVCVSVAFVQKVQNIHFIYAKANQAHTTSIYMWKPKKKPKLNKMKTKRIFGE